MSKLVIASIGPASSIQDGGRPGAQRYGLVPSGAMDRLALAAANTLAGNEPFTVMDTTSRRRQGQGMPLAPIPAKPRVRGARSPSTGSIWRATGRPTDGN